MTKDRFNLKVPMYFIFIISCLSLFASIAHAKEQKDWPKEITVGYQKSGSLIILKATGELEKRLEKHGVKVNWAEFQFGPPMLEALNAGKLDFGIVGETPPVIAQAATGSSLVYVANEPASPKGQGLLVEKDSSIKDVIELKGKKIAVAKGSSSHYFLVQALAKSGLTLNDIQPTYLAPAEAKAALSQGDVAAWAIWDYHYALAEIQTGAQLLVDGTGIVDNYYFYVSRRDFVNDYPEVLKLVLAEIDKTDEWEESNPAAAAAAISKASGVDATVFERAFRRRSGYGTQTIKPAVIAAQQKLADTFYSLGLIPKAIVVKEAVWQPE
jgi:sulfonate transport system substrate-binding protein